MRAAGRQHLCEIGSAVVAGLVGAEVQPHRDRTAGALAEAGGDGLHPVVVETEAVDGGAVLGQPEEAWARVAGLGKGVAAPTSQEAEARAGQLRKGGGVLVEARGKADRVQERHPRQGAGQPGRGDGAGQGRQTRGQRLQRQPVCAFRVHPAHEAEAEGFQQAHHMPSGKMWPVAPSGRDLSQTTSSSRSGR
ncbi:hypothetical protein MASR1M65_04550 [Saprospiraceae bacterium]